MNRFPPRTSLDTAGRAVDPSAAGMMIEQYLCMQVREMTHDRPRKGYRAGRPLPSELARRFRAGATPPSGAHWGPVLDIQHVGSTAVPGLDAKPIIDIAVAIASTAEIARCRQPLGDLGYIDRGDCGTEGGYLFVKESAPLVRTPHLHMIAAIGSGGAGAGAPGVAVVPAGTPLQMAIALIA